MVWCLILLMIFALRFFIGFSWRWSLFEIFKLIFDGSKSFLQKIKVLEFKYSYTDLLLYYFCPIINIYQLFLELFRIWSTLSNKILRGLEINNSLQFWPPELEFHRLVFLFFVFVFLCAHALFLQKERKNSNLNNQRITWI